MSELSIRELKAEVARLDREIDQEQQRHAAVLRAIAEHRMLPGAGNLSHALGAASPNASQRAASKNSCQ